MTRQSIALILLLASLLPGCKGPDLATTNSYQVPPPPPGSWETVPRGVFVGAVASSTSALFKAGPYRIINTTSYIDCDESGLEVVHESNNLAKLRNRVCLSPVPTVDGEPVFIDEVGLSFLEGQVVELTVPTESGQAARIDVRRAAVGTVESIDAEHAKLSVLGQHILVSDLTNFAGNTAGGTTVSLDSISVGDRLAISGHFSADGQVLATRVEAVGEDAPVVLRGILHGGQGQPFTIGGLQVDLSGAVLIRFPGGTPLAGDPVLLFADEDPVNGVLNARIARLTRWKIDIYRDPVFEYTGFLTAFEHGGEFQIAGFDFDYVHLDCDECGELFVQNKQVNPETLVTYSCCTLPGISNLVLGSAASNSTWLTGPIDSIDTANGSMSILGFSVQSSPATHISDSTEPWVGSSTFNIDELEPGETVTVRGGILDDKIIAGWIARAGEGSQLSPVRYALENPDIIFLGRRIVTDAATTVEACDVWGTCLTKTPDWLFSDQWIVPWHFTIDIEPLAGSVRATHVLARSDKWEH